MSRLFSITLLTTLLATSTVGHAADPIFIDGSAAADLDFTHFNGMTGKLHFTEMVGSGAAWLDYDRDGDLDLYLLQGSLVDPRTTLDDALLPPADADELGDRLLRNDLTRGPDGQLQPRFVDVTESAELTATGYGMTLAVGDADGDGYPDVFVGNDGDDQLWRNRRDGRFATLRLPAVPPGGAWTAAAFFGDIDRDGDDDLYVGRYVVYDPTADIRCFARSSRIDYCGPADFPPSPDSLWRNRGNGEFEDATIVTRLNAAPEPTLGVVTLDADGDGRLDLYLAHDGEPNRLWLAQPDGTFLDDALLAGVAVNRSGAPEASMGVTVGDVDADGDEDVFMTHLDEESNTLYRNGGGLFDDASVDSGLAAPSLPFTGFGTVFA
ncbi:MAG: VCBS repeat-containing protein, partial [Acidobacteriota bacterium]